MVEPEDGAEVVDDAGHAPPPDAGGGGAPPDAGHADPAGDDDAGFFVWDAGVTIVDAGACAMTMAWPDFEGAEHVQMPTPIAYDHNPPATGDHWPYWARWMIHETPLQREFYVHNLEHGGIVFLYGPRATAAQIAALKALYTATPPDPLCDDEHRRVLVTFDPQLDDVIAVVAWGVVLEGECVDPEAIAAFVQTYRGSGGEHECMHGWR